MYESAAGLFAYRLTSKISDALIYGASHIIWGLFQG